MATTDEPALRRRVPVETYKADLTTVPAAISRLLAEYSHIPVAQQKEHIKTVRDQAYKSHPYPCLGRWRFLELDLANHPLYHSDVLPALKPDPTQHWKFLDLGCCLAQDVRKLAFDGADISRIYGADLRPEFIDMGYALFRDENKLPRDHFIAPADVLDFSPDTELARKCDGTVGILHATAVFHLFDLPRQKIMANRCLKLLDPKRKRVLVCGGQVGNVTPSVVQGMISGGTRFRHNEDSWKDMWKEVVAQEEWKDKIRGVEVHSVMVQAPSKEPQRNNNDGSAADEATEENEADNALKQIGGLEEGFRWMKYWVWVDFADNA